uniref:Ig-like domain-containing protein n=1 Tax=Maylandia zebra TaxID=106582 RepID=A0A3P9DCR0_9CICH
MRRSVQTFAWQCNSRSVRFVFSTFSQTSHMLKYFGTGTSGNPDIAEFMFVLEVDDTEVLYCDASKKIVEPRQDGVKKMLDDNPGALGEYTQQCFEHQPGIYQNSISNLKQLLNQSGGVHILQCMIGSEMNENSGEVKGFLQLGYNGEGYLEFDLKTMTWIPLKPEFNIVKQTMDGDRNLINYLGNLFGTIFLERLKMFLDYGSSSLNKTVLPPMSLLQKTPSSPVSCHATGFYPDRAAFWRKDGVEIHEGVDPGEILPNNDETFQMSVDLNISSVTPEDWRRYDCVFQLSGVSEDIIIKLNKTIIKTNLVNNKTHIDAGVQQYSYQYVSNNKFFLIYFINFSSDDAVCVERSVDLRSTTPRQKQQARMLQTLPESLDSR